MVIISNSQRDQVVRYLQILCSNLVTRTDLRSINTRRMASRLVRQLVSRPAVGADELPKKQPKSAR